MDEGKEKERRMEEVQEQMTAKQILYRKKDSSWFGSDYKSTSTRGARMGVSIATAAAEC